jgi:hypothetical protein
LTPEIGSTVMYVAFGAGVLLAGIGFCVMCLRAGSLLERAGGTLNEIDRQINTLSTPVATTLTHVGGIADTADTTLARLAALVGQLENVASGASKTANLIGSTLSGVTNAMKHKPRDGQDDGGEA